MVELTREEKKQIRFEIGGCVDYCQIISCKYRTNRNGNLDEHCTECENYKKMKTLAARLEQKERNQKPKKGQYIGYTREDVQKIMLERLEKIKELAKKGVPSGKAAMEIEVSREAMGVLIKKHLGMTYTELSEKYKKGEME